MGQNEYDGIFSKGLFRYRWFINCFKPLAQDSLTHDFNARGVVGNVASSSLTGVWSANALSKVKCGMISIKVKGTLLCGECEKYNFQN